MFYKKVIKIFLSHDIENISNYIKIKEKKQLNLSNTVKLDNYIIWIFLRCFLVVVDICYISIEIIILMIIKIYLVLLVLKVILRYNI